MFSSFQVLLKYQKQIKLGSSFKFNIQLIEQFLDMVIIRFNDLEMMGEESESCSSPYMCRWEVHFCLFVFYLATWCTCESCISKASVKGIFCLNLTQHLVFVRKPKLQMICQLTFTVNELISVLLALNTDRCDYIISNFCSREED